MGSTSNTTPGRFKVKIEVEFKGLDKALTQLAQYGKKGKKGFQKVIRAGATAATKEARKLTPKDSGTLRKSLISKIKVYRNSDMMVAIIGPKTKMKVAYKNGIRWPSKYANLVHGGTRRTKATPFLRQAVQGRAAVIEAAMAKKLAEVLRNGF